MIEAKLIRVAPDAINRCQASGLNGQCPFASEEGQEYCPRHSSKKTKFDQDKRAVRNYRLGQYQARVDEFADNDKIKSLREEIGILRMTLEQIVGSCKSNTELIIYSGRISDIVVRIEKLVSSCHRLEVASGELLDKQKQFLLRQVLSILLRIILRMKKYSLVLVMRLWLQLWVSQILTHLVAYHDR